jgi:L-asparaginase II
LVARSGALRLSPVTPIPLVREIRSGLEESMHSGDIAVVDVEGRLVASAGDPQIPLFARSSMKPLQASVSLSLAPFDFPLAEVAVMCASHNAEPVHVETVRSLLARSGVPESALRCPPFRPWDEETAATAPERLPINSDCSGKHGGMLAACRAQGWPLESYRSPKHPLQHAVLQAVLRATGLPGVRIGVDGCGVPVHGMPLGAMARLYALLTAPGKWGGLESHVARAVQAMIAEPYLVAGRNRVDTAVMQAAPGLVVKGGAEGLVCAAWPAGGVGVAVKIRDGGPRATGPALIHTLASLGALTGEHVTALAAFARPAVLGGGEPVGELVADFALNLA